MTIMRLVRLVVVMSWTLSGLAGGAAASGPQLIIEQPAGRFLVFPATPFEQESAAQRVVIRNVGDPVYHQWIEAAAPFFIVATGGGFDTGEEQYWDIACTPDFPDNLIATGSLRIDVCGVTCDDEWIDSIYLECTLGLLDTPSSNVALFAYRDESADELLSFTNPGPDPITITGLTSHHPVFAVAPVNATLPVTLAAGDPLEVRATFTSTGTTDVFAYIDVLADTVIAGRVQLDGTTLHQTKLATAFFGMPLGATYALPITVHNPGTSARTITALTSEHPEDVVRGLAGTTVVPGGLVRGFVELTGSALGFRDGTLTLAFDGRPSDAVAFRFYTEAATYAVTAGDATPTDGTIDFGTHRTGAGTIERSFTFTNLTTSDQQIAFCNWLYPPFDIVGGCPTRWPATGSIQVTVRFTPDAPGAYAASVNLVRNDARNFFGFVTASVVANQLALSASALAFPAILPGSSAQLAVTLTNRADDPITVPIAVTGASFAAQATGVALEGGAAAEVVVEFRPATAGAFTGTLELGTAGDVDQAIVALTGTAADSDEPPSDAGTDAGDAPTDAPIDAGGDGGPYGGGCSAGGPAGGLAIATMALLHRRAPRRRRCDGDGSPGARRTRTGVAGAIGAGERCVVAAELGNRRVSADCT